jgi:membrane associated rhomboid family serine protease
MALADREYFRYDRDPYRGRRNPIGRLFADAPVTMTLIALNVGVFFLDRVVTAALGPIQGVTPEGQVIYFRRLELWGHFSAGFALYQFQLWRLLTFQFLHANLTHLLFNMISLYIFGPMVEQHLGRARFIRFYLICGVGGAVAYLGLLLKGVLISDMWVPLVGASAGIFGILVAAAHVAPNAMIMMLFPPVPMRLRTLAWVFIAIAVYTVFTRGRNAGGEAAHLGGAIVGFLLMQGEHLLSDQRRQRRGFPFDGY